MLVMNIEEKIINIVKEVMIENDPGTINSIISRSSDLRKDLNFDSLALAILTVNIEELFNVDIFEKDSGVNTVGDVIQAVKENEP